MGISALLVLGLAAGVVLVVGGGLMMYMSNLVRSAYEIKVQINNDVDERLGKMAEDLDKKSRWIKRDLLEELDKIKVAFATDNASKVSALSEPLLKKVEGVEQMLRDERTEWMKAVEADRQSIAALENKVKLMRRDIKRVEERVGLSSAPTPSGDDSAPSLSAEPKLMGAIPGVAATPRPPPTGPQSVRDFLPDLA